MGAVNTTYTFTPTDVITSSKMNDIIDQTTMTGSAIDGSTLQVTGAGQLKVNAQGITSNELAAASVTQAKIGTNVAGTGPFLKAEATGITTSIPSGVTTKVQLDAELFDTNSNFANSRFTPTVAGYYLVIGSVGFPTAALSAVAVLYKNNSQITNGTQVSSPSNSSNLSNIVLMNGSTDYLELFAYQNSGGALSTGLGLTTFLSCCLIRAA
jgi:hypothetical protein